METNNNQPVKTAEEILKNVTDLVYIDIPYVMKGDFANHLPCPPRTVALKSMYDFASQQQTTLIDEVRQAIDTFDEWRSNSPDPMYRIAMQDSKVLLSRILSKLTEK